MGSKNKNNDKKMNKSSGESVAGDSAGKGETITGDPRFAKFHYDPRFQKAPRHKAKVSIDSRFDRMFTDKEFASSSAPVDKRGKPKKQSENALKRYYHLEDEKVDEKEKLKKNKKNFRVREDESEEEEEEEKDEKEEMKKKKKKEKLRVEEEESCEEEEEKMKRKLRVKEEEESSDESAALESGEEEESGGDSSAADTDTDTEEDGEEMLGDEASVEVENVPVIEEETRRLAVVNMDWTQVKAVDLFVMLRSCLPKGGQIKSVTVYPSEFGLKRMEEEAVHGPVALFQDDKKKEKEDDSEDNGSENDDSEDDGSENDDSEDDGIENDNDDSEDDIGEDDNSENDDSQDDIGEDDDSEDDDEEEIDTEKLRAYEKSRLRYYYAVVECDSIATADYLYKTCDGIEFERSSNVLDLRFIPDSMEFQHPPRDVATEAPADYEGLDFHTRALQHSNTVLSWDDDEPHRVKTLRRKFNDKQLAELELKEFLASDESESDDDDNENGEKDLTEKMKKVEKYRALVQNGDGSEEEEGEGQDMEVTFNTGLEDISKRILQQKDRGSETVWEAYLRKKKEKKKSRKYRSKNSSDDDSEESDQEALEQPDDFFEEEPSAAGSKNVGQGKKKRDEKRLLEQKEKEAEASRAELELLLADENGTDKKLKGYKIKQKKAKGKKGEEVADEVKIPTAELEDPRFAALFNNPGFALDPTDPQFKRTATYLRQAAKRQQKSQEDNIEPIEPPRETLNDSVSKEDKHSLGTSQREKRELSSIVKSLKLKSQQLTGPSSTEIRKTKMDSNQSNLKRKKHKLPKLDGTVKKKAKV